MMKALARYNLHCNDDGFYPQQYGLTADKREASSRALAAAAFKAAISSSWAVALRETIFVARKAEVFVVRTGANASIGPAQNATTAKRAAPLTTMLVQMDEVFMIPVAFKSLCRFGTVVRSVCIDSGEEPSEVVVVCVCVTV